MRLNHVMSYKHCWIYKGLYMPQDLTFSIWLCASFYESDRVFNELSARFNELHYLIHDVWAVDRKTETLAVIKLIQC